MGPASLCPSCLRRLIQEAKRVRVYPDQETEDTVFKVVYSQENTVEHHSIILTLYISKIHRPHALDQSVHRALDLPVTVQCSHSMRPNYPETSNKLTSIAAGPLTAASLPVPLGTSPFRLAAPAHHPYHMLVLRVHPPTKARQSPSLLPIHRTPGLSPAQDRRAYTRVEGCRLNRRRSSLQDSRARCRWVSRRMA